MSACNNEGRRIRSSSCSRLDDMETSRSSATSSSARRPPTILDTRPGRAFSGNLAADAPALNAGARAAPRSRNLVVTPRIGVEFDADLSRPLGHGGFGTVYRAKHRVDGRLYAIKVVKFQFKPRYMFESEFIENLVMKEAKCLSGFDHPNIVRYYQGWIEDARFIVLNGRARGGAMRGTDLGDSANFEDDEDYDDEDYDDECESTVSDSRAPPAGHSRGRRSNKGAQDKNDCTSTTITDSANDQTTTWLNTVTAATTEQWQSTARSATFCVTVCMQMAYYRKNTLRHWLEDPSQSRDLCEVHRIFIQIVKAVEYIHLQGLVHRDIKPANVFMCEDGVKVGDFGLTKESDPQEESRSGSPVPVPVEAALSAGRMRAAHTRGIGTPLYASPEQKEGTCLGCKSDIFSLGIILIEMLVKFGTVMERNLVLEAAREGIIPKGIDEEHAALIKSMLSREPYERPDAFEILDEPCMRDAIRPAGNVAGLAEGAPVNGVPADEVAVLRDLLHESNMENSQLRARIAALEFQVETITTR